MKFKKKSIEVDAEQYQPGKPTAGVTERPPELIFSRDGTLFYLHDAELRADCWLPVTEPGDAFPFAFYEVKSGERRTATNDDPLVKRYLAYQKTDKLSDPYAYVTTANGEKCRVVAGDWVIAEPDGRGFYPCKPDIFVDRYEAA